MEFLEKINISHIIWYLLPGLALTIIIIFPLAFLNLNAAIKFLEILGTAGIIVLGIVLGFILEGMRLYRFRPKYKGIRQDFFTALQTTLNTTLNPYYIVSRSKDLAKEKKIYEFDLRHSIWIMLGQLTILFFLEFIFWLCYLMYICYFSTQNVYNVFNIQVTPNITFLIVIILSILFLAITLRLYAVSIQEQETTNDMILTFVQQNSGKIKDML